MGTVNRRRQLNIGIWTISVLLLVTVVLSLIGDWNSGVQTLVRLSLIAFAIVMAVFLRPLVRGTEKDGRPLAFEPFRWQLIFTGAYFAFGIVLVIWQLTEDPQELHRVAWVPGILAGSVGSMYRPAGTRAEWLGTGRKSSAPRSDK